MLLKTVLFAFLATAVHAGPVDFTKDIVVSMCYLNNVDKVEQVNILMDEYIECYPKMADFEELPAEFIAAKNGDVDAVARNICAKAAIMKTCTAKLNYATAVCTKLDEKDTIFGIDISNHAIDYMCYEEDGKTRLAKFVEDGGVQCLTSHTFSHCVRSVSAGLRALFEDISKCVVDELKTCSSPAAIRLQGMFDYIRSESPSSGNNQLLL